MRPLHKKFFIQSKKKAKHYLGMDQNSLLLNYQNALNRFSKKKFTIIEEVKFLDEIKKHNKILISDFHTYDQNIKNFLRILSYLYKGNTSIIVCLEIFNFKDSTFLESYLNKQITIKELLEVTNFFYKWPIPWKNYAKILYFCLEKKIKLFGVNSDGSLSTRDQKMAENILNLEKQFPDHQILLLCGELHLTPTKIPALLKSSSKTPAITIHQNLDGVFDKIDNSRSQVLSFDSLFYSLESSPPWIKYESLNYWYENIIDDLDFEDHDYYISDQYDYVGPYVSKYFEETMNIVNNHVNLDYIRITDINLYNNYNLEYLNSKINEIDCVVEKKYYLFLIEGGHPFYIPQFNIFYSGQMTINSLSYLIGIFIFLRNRDNSINKNDLLFKLVRTYFSAHYINKIINPHKKCNKYLNFLASYKYSCDKNIKENNLLVLNILDRKLKDTSKIKSLKSIHSVSKLLGHFLAEYIFEQLDRDVIYKEIIDKKNFFLEDIYKLLETSIFKNYKNDYKKIF